ncbi:MAG: hypothetical protein NTV01_11735 [Bacteroidia bacterium]|nr:hypothetical protein [Bacteroidia bacterium]
MRFKLLISLLLLPVVLLAGPIRRKALVERHSIQTSDVSQILALGNGEFCVGVDGTGMQTFGGNIMAHWAWHSFPLPEGATMADVPETGTIETGKLVGEMKHASARQDVSDWMFQSPHRFSFCRFRLTNATGKIVTMEEVKNTQRTLDLWRGIQTAEYSIGGHPVKVQTVVHPDMDEVAVRIESDLISTGELAVELEFPYPLGSVANEGQDPWYGNWDEDSKHNTQVTRTKTRADFLRSMDQTVYHASWSWSDPAASFEGSARSHTFRLSGAKGSRSLDFVCSFSLKKPGELPGFDQVKKASAGNWENYWLSGGAIDLSGSKDPRWKELERRVVLSQYLMGTQSAGSWPPAEMALMGGDAWSSQFHMEMVWWHLAHYGLWDRWDKAAKALGCYESFLPVAIKLARQFDYKGAKWGKQVGPEGRTAPWGPTYILSWQQPHPIFFAELEYRLTPTMATLKKWEFIVNETAEYLADFPVLKADGKYHLTPIRTANENGNGDDPAFESAYWRWALAKAQEWRERLGLEPIEKWNTVLENLAPLPESDGAYLFCNNWTDSYTKLNKGHPDPLGVCAFLPLTKFVDAGIARQTVEKVFKTWKWENTWGWDFPWAAMAAARVGRPDLAIEALLNESKQNGFTVNGINEGWYFPGNGGLLYAVAMMAAGWDGGPDKNAPGFPDNGQWVVKWDGLKQAL